MNIIGIDLAVEGKDYTVLNSNVNGRVTNVSTSAVQIQEASGKKHEYANLEEVSVEVGSQVSVGSLIGILDASKGLHYGVSK